MNIRAYLAKLRAKEVGGSGRADEQLTEQPIGNQFLQRELRNPLRGMRVGSRSAAEEAQADRTAEGIMRGSVYAGQKITTDDSAKFSSSQGGQLLDPAARTFFEPHFGDLSSIRIHDDSTAAAGATDMGARAYTVGRDIGFAAGEYAPGSDRGKRLIAHELTHVAQGGDVARRQPEENEDDLADEVPLPPLNRSLSLISMDEACGGHCVTDEELFGDMDRARAAEKAEEEAKKEAEEERRYEAANFLIKLLTDHGRKKSEIVDYLSELGLLHIVRFYGVEMPGRFTKRAAYQEDVKNALFKYREEWLRRRNINGSRMNPLTEEDIAALQETQKRAEFIAAWLEGYEYVTSSLLSAAAADVAARVTDDPKKVTAAAGAAYALSGASGAYARAKGNAGSYSPGVENDPNLSSPVGSWRYAGPSSPAAPVNPVRPQSLGGGGGLASKILIALRMALTDSVPVTGGSIGASSGSSKPVPALVARDQGSTSVAPSPQNQPSAQAATTSVAAPTSTQSSTPLRTPAPASPVIPGFDLAFSESTQTYSDAPYETTTRLKQGNFGEREAARALAELGHTILYFKPDILGTNQGGIDIVTMLGGRIYFIDNKAYTTGKNVSSVSALDTNFTQNLRAIRAEFAAYVADPARSAAERNLYAAAVAAIDAGNYQKAVTTFALAPPGSQSTGTTSGLQSKGFIYIDLFPFGRD